MASYHTNGCTVHLYTIIIFFVFCRTFLWFICHFRVRQRSLAGQMFIISCFYFVSQQKKIEMKESLILELEEKKKQIEYERTAMDLTGGE